MDARRRLSLAIALAALSAQPAQGAAPVSTETLVARAARAALEPSALDRFVRGEQHFQFAPGRLYEVWTTPLRVTTLSLSPGEEVIAIAAGDTVRWQIAQASSGEGPSSRAHVLIKPFERGLSTNLVLTSNRRIYFVSLRSGAAFHSEVSWTPAATAPEPVRAPLPPPAAPPAPEPQLLETEFSITPKGRRPAWTPTAVMTDGARTFIAFPAHVASIEAPVLTLIGEDGRPALVNYRQRGALFIVDGVIGLAELRLGKAQVVRITRQAGGGR